MHHSHVVMLRGDSDRLRQNRQSRKPEGKISRDSRSSSNDQQQRATATTNSNKRNQRRQPWAARSSAVATAEPCRPLSPKIATGCFRFRYRKWVSVQSIQPEIERLALRIQKRLDAGWCSVKVVTDLGWLFCPDGRTTADGGASLATTAKPVDDGGVRLLVEDHGLNGPAMLAVLLNPDGLVIAQRLIIAGG
jgi:hypothetical protein